MSPLTIDHLHNSNRAADETLRGYLTQFARTALLWIGLAPNAALLCEGNEDIDRVLLGSDGVVTSLTEEQVKDLAGRITARTPGVYESIFNFLDSFVRHRERGLSCHFAFWTTAAVGVQQLGGDARNESRRTTPPISADLLRAWIEFDGSEAAVGALVLMLHQLVEGYRDSLPKPREGRTRTPHLTPARLQEVVATLDEDPSAWGDFLRAVLWETGEASGEALHEKIVAEVRADPRFAAVASVAESFARLLVYEVLVACTSPDPQQRLLTPQHLVTLLGRGVQSLERWYAEVHPERLDRRLTDLERRVSDLETPALTEDAKQRYFRWAALEAGRFLVLGRAEPVDTMQVQRVTALPAHERGFDARFTLDGPNRLVVLVADGGSGKSTLLRHLAARALNRGELALRVRLPQVLRGIEDRLTFAAALAASIDTPDLSRLEREAVVQRATTLLADGLDECEEQAPSVVGHLVRWAADGGRRVVVTTRRPLGELAARRGFFEARIQPLSDREMSDFVEWLASVLGQGADNTWALVGRCRTLLEHVGLEASPLHVSIVVALADQEVASLPSRTALLDAMVERLMLRPVQDRELAAERRKSAARECLAELGWRLLEAPQTPLRVLVAGIASAIAQPESTTESLVHYWVDRALLLKSGTESEERVEFFHAKFRDHAAGRYLAAAPREQRERLLRDHARSTDLLRFAVGHGGPTLLSELLAVLDPGAFEDTLLVLDACREITVPIQGQLAASLVAWAEPRLLGSVETETLEVVDALCRTSLPPTPEAIDLAMRALEAPQRLVRLAGLKLLLAGSPTDFSAKRLVAEIDGAREAIRGEENGGLWQWDRAGLRTLWNDVLGPAVEYMFRIEPGPNASALLRSLMFGEVISSGAHGKLVVLARRLGQQDLVDEWAARDHGHAAVLSWQRDRAERVPDADTAFLEQLIAALTPTASAGIESGAGSSEQIGRLLGAMNWMNMASALWNEGMFRNRPRVVQLVLRAYVQALGLDATTIITEARAWLARLPSTADGVEGGSGQRYGIGLRGVYVESPASPRWERVPLAETPIELLLLGLRSFAQPFWFASAELLAVHPDREAVAAVLEDGLRKPWFQLVLLVRAHATTFWGARANAVLTEVLECSLDKITAPLLDTLASIPGSGATTLIARGLASPDPHVVGWAARASSAAGTVAPGLIDPLYSSLEAWLEKLESAERDGLNPRTIAVDFDRLEDVPVALFHALSLSDRYDDEEFLDLALRPGLRLQVIDDLTARGKRSGSLIGALAQRARGSPSANAALAVLAKMPADLLGPIVPSLLDLCVDSDREIRENVLHVLRASQLGWATLGEVLGQLLKDEDPAIRDLASLASRDVRSR